MLSIVNYITEQLDHFSVAELRKNFSKEQAMKQVQDRKMKQEMEDKQLQDQNNLRKQQAEEDAKLKAEQLKKEQIRNMRTQIPPPKPAASPEALVPGMKPAWMP